MAVEKDRRILDEQLSIAAKMINDQIVQNARVARIETKNNERYDALVG